MMSETKNNCAIILKSLNGASDAATLMELNVEGAHKHLVEMIGGAMDISTDFEALIIESVVLHLARKDHKKFSEMIKAMRG